MDKSRVIMGAAGCLFVLALVFLGSTGRDDSHITYYVADMIAAGEGIINYNGAVVEQSSTFLYTAILAGLVWITGLSAATLGPFLSMALLVLSVPLVWAMLRTIDRPAAIAVLPMLAPAVLYWSFSGMENSLYIIVLLLAIFSVVQRLNTGRPVWLGGVFLAMAAVTLTRPEAVVVAICIGAGSLVLAPSFMAWARVMGTTLAAAAAAIALRLLLGLRLFPNPVYAKQDLDFADRLHGGYSHFANTMVRLPVSSVAATLLALAALLFLLRGLRQRDATWQFAGAAFLVAVTAGSFAFLSGGDWMENGRFLVPAFFFGVLAAFVVMPASARTIVAGLWMLAVAADLVRMTTVPYGGLPLFAPYRYEAQAYTPSWIEGYNTIHARDMTFTDAFLEVLENDPRDRIVFASIQAGLVPYYLFQNSSKDLEFVDLYGLSTDHVLDCDLSWSDTDPYPQLEAIQDCVGLRFDYIYDIDAQWERVTALTGKGGCTEILRQDLVVDTVPWKEPNDSRLFLVRCGDPAPNAQ